MNRLAQALARLRTEFRLRSLDPPGGIDFTSNDYLGLAHHPALADAVVAAVGADGIVGSGGSRLLRGHHPAHADLEARAARFFDAERALYFSTGFLANLALFTTLPDRRDAVVMDSLIHASVKEAVHAGPASRYKARHNDAQAFEDAVRRARARGARDIWMAVESVYSMDGDAAPLDDLAAIAAAHDATLVADEAHATGVFGATGRGLAEGRDDCRMIALHTCGKALGVAGGIITGPAVVVDYLINAARPFIYSTAPPPMIARAVSRALDLVDEEPWRRQALTERIALARHRLSAAAPGAVPDGFTPIIPVVLGADRQAVETAMALQRAGFDVRAIRPPTVPAGTARLRITVSLDRTEAEIDGLARALAHTRHATAA